MNTSRVQAWVLRLVGLVEMLAFVSVVMPASWMHEGHAQLGMPEMPPSPVFDAVMRQVSFTYALHGLALWFIAADVVRYRPLVILTGFGYLVTAPVFLAIDLSAGLPWFWWLGNGGSCLLIGIILLGLLAAARRAQQTAPAAPRDNLVS